MDHFYSSRSTSGGLCKATYTSFFGSAVCNKAKGFTLIELMIVVGVIAVILTLAVPAYSNYMVRTKVAEALALAAGAKTAVSTTCVEDPTIASINSSNLGYAFNGATDYVLSIAVSGPCLQPVISVQTRNTGTTPDPVITLTGLLTAGHIQFTCTTNGLNIHVPKDCRT